MSMSMDEFDRLLGAWGADPRRWPDDRRKDAEALLSGSDAARQRLAEEQAFDTLLAHPPAAVPSDALVEAVMAIPRTARQERRAGRGWSLNLFAALPRFAGLAAAAVLGFYIGTTSLFEPAQSMAADRETVNISDYVFGETVDGGITP
jgi:hypothetical protein